MRRPLAGVVLAYVGGILLGDCFPLPLAGLFVLAFICAGACLLCRRWRPYVLVLLLVLTGWTNITSRTAVISSHDLRNLLGPAPEILTLRGTLLTAPVERTVERDGEEHQRTLVFLEVTVLRRKGDWEPAFGTVAASTTGTLIEPLFRGQHVEVTGVIQPPPPPVAEGLFDYRAFLRRKGVHYQFRVERSEDWQVMGGNDRAAVPPLADRFQRWAQHTLALGMPREDEPLRLLWAMALGWKTAMTDEVAEPFMRSGTMHIFAISGLHIALIAGILVSLLRVVMMPRGACGVVAIPLLWFYTAATDWQPSAIRSTIMMSIVIGGWSLKRPGDLLNSLAGAALIILVWDPQQMFQASFQLSFVVVLSIGLLLPHFEKVGRRLLQSDPLLPAELRPTWQRRLDWPLRFVTTSLATSLAAWLGSLPLVACYFHLLTPVSLLANLVIVPLSELALMSNFGSLVCGTWLPWVTELFNHSGWFWMNAMNRSSQWFAGLPGAYRYLPAPPLVVCLVYYALLFGALTGWLLAPNRRRWAALGLGLIALVGIWQWQPQRATVRLTVLAARAGDALLIDAPGSAGDLLIDCSDQAGAQSLVKPFLHGQGIERLAGLVLSHGDARNVGGTELMHRDFHIGTTITSGARFRSPVYRNVVRRLEPASGRWRCVGPGEEVNGWQVWHPAPEDRFPLADDSALVLRGEFHGTRVLLLSDLGQAGQRAVLERGGDMRADIVVTGVPARDEPLGEALLAAVQPRAIVVSAAESPATERPSSHLRERLARCGVPVFYTSQSGSVTITIARESWKLAAMNGAQFTAKPGAGKTR